MQSKTVAQVAMDVLNTAQASMTVAEITQIIVEQKLYSFNTEDPRGIVRGAIERRCDGLERKNSTGTKLFRKEADGKFSVLSLAK